MTITIIIKIRLKSHTKICIIKISLPALGLDEPPAAVCRQPYTDFFKLDRNLEGVKGYGHKKIKFKPEVYSIYTKRELILDTVCTNF